MVNTMIVMILLMINYEFSDHRARVARLILSSVCERGRGERLGGKRGELEEQRLRSPISDPRACILLLRDF